MNDSPQFKRTDRAIAHALMVLLKEKSFEKITVQDILHATPVTRSTFYKHFRDKYEIAEKMQDYYFSLQFESRKLLLTDPSSPQLLRAYRGSEELLDALLKIRTEKVDIREAIARQSELHYLSNTNGPNKEIEAQVYAHALTAFQLANEKRKDFSFEYMDSIFISAMLMLLGLPNDEEIIRLIQKKLAAKPKRQPEQIL